MTISTSSDQVFDLSTQSIKGLNRIHPNKKLNTWMPLCTLENLEMWTKESVNAIYWDLTDVERAKLTAEKVKKVYAAQKVFRNKHNQQVYSCVKSIGFIMDAKQYLFYCIGEVVKELSLNINDDESIYQGLEKFKQDFVQIRYNSGKHEENVQRCKAFIKEILDRFSLIGQGSYALSLKPYLMLCEDLLDNDDLLEASLGSLFSKVHTHRQRISVEMLAEGFYYSGRVLKQEVDRVLSLVQKKLEPFVDQPPHTLQYSQELTDWAHELKLSISTKIEELCARDPKSIAHNYDKSIEFSKEVFSLTSEFELATDSPTFGSNHRQLNILQRMLSLGKESVENEKQLIDWDAILLNKLRGTMGASIGKHTVEEFSAFVAFQKSVFECHLLIDGFILPHVNSMLRASVGIKDWFDANKPRVGRLLKIYRESKAQHTQPKRVNLSIDELVEFINAGNNKNSSCKKKKAKKRKKTNNTPSTSKKVCSSPNSTNFASASQVKVYAASSNMVKSKIPIHKKIYEGLRAIVLQSSADPIEKTAARQAMVNLQDILAIKGRLTVKEKASQNIMVMALETLMTFQAAYYHMEQTLRLENLKRRIDKSARLAFHNLQHQATPLGMENENIVYELRMVNAWTPDTHRQMSQWESLREFRGKEPPKALTEIHEVIGSQLATSVTNNKLKRYLKDSLAFTASFYSSVDKIHEIEPPTLFSMKASEPFDCSFLDEICEKIRSQIQSLKQCDDSPLKLLMRQTISNLQTLKSVLSELSQDSMSSLEFSYFIRQAFYWQGQVMEKMLQAILLKNRGEDWKKEHHLDRMYEKIFDEPSEVLKNVWKQWHNVTRYPYETRAPQSPIHSLILAAEVLRDMPHLDAGFSFADKKTTFQNQQHAIPVAKELLQTKAVINGLSEVVETFKNTVETKLLPELF